ncbi:MAG: secretin N-terminal domain-containing protein [Rhodanobacter sp.]
MKGLNRFALPRLPMAFLSLLLVLVSGCANLQHEDGEARRAASYIEAEQAKVLKPQPVGVRTSESWLLGKPAELQPEISPVLQRKIAWNPTKKISLAELAAYMTRTTGLPVDVSEVMRIGGAAAQDQLIAPGVGGMPGATIAAPTTLQGTAGAASQRMSYMPLPLLDVNFDGDVKGMLDFAANECGIYWSLQGGTVKFFRTLSKTFYIPALNRKSTGTNSIKAQSSANAAGTPGAVGATGESGGSGSSSGLNSSTTADVDFWKTIEQTVKTVAGSDAQVAVDPSFMSVTVTGTPMQVHNVEVWVKGISDHTSQKVLITMQTYRVTLSKEDYANWDPQAIIKKMSSAYGFSLTGAGAPPVAGGLPPAVLSATAGSGSRLNGSEVALGALSTLGNVKEGILYSTMTLNGQPANIQIGNNRTYVASNGSTQTANVGTSTQMTPGVASSGLTVNFTPNVINGMVYLTMDLNNITLNAIDQITSNGQIMQLPNISPTLISESTALRPGEAMLLSSITIDNTSTTRSGTFSPYNPLLGGGVDGTHKKQLIAVVVTATVL